MPATTLNVWIPCDPTIPLLGMCPSERNPWVHHSCIQTFPSSIIHSPHVYHQENGHLHTMEYLTLRRNTLQQHTYISKTSQLTYGLIGGELYWMREAEGPRVLVIIPAHLWFVLVSICVSASLKNLLTIKEKCLGLIPRNSDLVWVAPGFSIF